MSDGNDLLMSGGRPWASWSDIGDEFNGTVIEPPLARQARDFDSGEPAWWDDNETDPKMEVVVAVQTDLRDPEVDFDDGSRTLVLPKGSQRFKAVQNAVRAAKAKGIEVGAEISVTYTGDDKPKKRGLNGAKQYSATYTPPTPAKKKAAASSKVEKDALDALAGLVE